MERKLDLTISHSLIGLRSRACDEEEMAWGEGNQAQGLLLLDGLVVMDPLADEEFGADVILRTPERFSADKRAQRTLQLPFTIFDNAELVLFSADEELPVELDTEPGDYTLIYEICVGHDVFYTLTLLKGKAEAATALKADGWGLKKGQILLPGFF
ncbi:MAG: competence protein ComJ [Pedobacter sp.]|nr:competence protein ComJ [Pedobacter sp.]